ncbi:toprim domain-containing protein [Brevundimonas sp.]|uniref:toprim domain-containing protein n=1 Tax=Brevundimonas sp. TaxID=1871086 RepID=UPI0028A776D4|nr:toprim domain-containing protein [Brevundimonas sp.]
MSLRSIVTALGGDLYQNGARANVPAPGHGAGDRSVSLMLSEARVVVHSFGAADWREVRDDLCRRGLVDSDGRLTGSGGLSGAGASTPRRCALERRAVAQALWAHGIQPGEDGVVVRHLRSRAVSWSAALCDLREHPRAPLSVYGPSGRTGRALMAGVRDPHGALTAVELTHLTPNGRVATGLRAPRKTVGQVPGGSAVRLCPAAARMVVAEGVITTLSAMARFERPGWALMAAGNLARWRPPSNVNDILIAADRDEVGERAARALEAGLRARGLVVDVAFPPAPFGDWNEAAQAEARGRREEGRVSAPDRRG